LKEILPAHNNLPLFEPQRDVVSLFGTSGALKGTIYALLRSFDNESLHSKRHGGIGSRSVG
jgi:hypothetical protein